MTTHIDQAEDTDELAQILYAYDTETQVNGDPLVSDGGEE